MEATSRSIDRRMDKEDVHIYNVILVIKKNKIMLFASTWIELEIIILSEVKDKYITYVESNKNDTNEFICKTETDSHFSNKLMVAKDETWVGR